MAVLITLSYAGDYAFISLGFSYTLPISGSVFTVKRRTVIYMKLSGASSVLGDKFRVWFRFITDDLFVIVFIGTRN